MLFTTKSEGFPNKSDPITEVGSLLSKVGQAKVVGKTELLPVRSTMSQGRDGVNG